MPTESNDVGELIDTQRTAPARLAMPPIPDFLDRRKPVGAGDGISATSGITTEASEQVAPVRVSASVSAPLADTANLPGLVERAAQALASAKTHAEVLEAREVASLAYDAAKRGARLAEAMRARDNLVDEMRRVQAYALEVDAHANCRLADEYDAAQEGGEAATGSVRTDIVPDGNDVGRPATAQELGLSRKEIYEARRIRDAETKYPGIVHRTLEERIARGEEPTRAAVRRAVAEALGATARVHGSGEAQQVDRPGPGGAVKKLLKGCGFILESADHCDWHSLTVADVTQIEAARDALSRALQAGQKAASILFAAEGSRR